MSILASTARLRAQQLRELFSELPKDATDGQRRSHERYRRILMSGATASAAKVCSALVGLVSIPLAMNYLGKDQFGIWMIVSSLVLWMQIADFGIGNGLANALAEADGRDDMAAARSYAASAVLACTLLAAIMTPLLTAVVFTVDWESFLRLTTSDGSSLRLALMIVGASFLANIPLSLAVRVYTAFQRAYIVNWSHIAASILSLAGLYLAIRLDLGFLWLVALAGIPPTLCNLALWLSLRQLTVARDCDIRLMTKPGIQRVAKSSVPLFLFQVGALCINQLVNVLVVRQAGLGVVADYNIILSIYLIVFTSATALSNPFFAAIREAFERHETLWVKAAIMRGLSIRMAVVGFFSIVFVLFGDSILERWLGKTMTTPLGTVGWLCVAFSLVMSSCSSHISEILNWLDDLWIQVWVVFGAAAVVVAVLHVAVPAYGVAGIFLAMATSTFVPIFIYIPRLRELLRRSEHS